MKSFILILLFTGILLMVLGYVKEEKQCPVKIEYRYIDRDGGIIEVGGNLYQDLFQSGNVWKEGLGDHMRKNILQI
jgi:hypothetical protein